MAIAVALFLFFAIAGAIGLFGYRRWVRVARVYDNLELGRAADKAPGAPLMTSVTQFVEGIGNKLPPPPATSSRHRTELTAAGFRSTRAPAVYYGAKLILMGGLGVAAFLLQFHMRLSLMVQVAYIGVVALAGFRLPDFVVARLVRKRHRLLRLGLPDALDLMVLCAESGMALDRTLRVVSRELADVHPVLSEELNLVTLEMLAGTRRRQALENLGLRTQEPGIKKLATALTQADRFGTEISTVLRAHADFLRVRRRLEAEERAAKVAVKLVFPILFFILPCIILVTLGPSALRFMQNISPALKG
jgi:tight adherence protein C